MAKLIFRYGAMGASKTANALMVKFNYEERKMHAIILKPECENRDGGDIIRSRIGLKDHAFSAESFLSTPEGIATLQLYNAIIVDEIQFLGEEYIDRLAELVDELDIPVICYGLRTDFQGHLFPGSRRLMELADEIEEIPTICWCGKKARFNARIRDGKVVSDGDVFELGGNDSYTALCRKHFRLKKIH